MSKQGNFSQINDWYSAREPRERVLIMVMAVLAFAILVHLAIWTPLSDKYFDTEKKLKKMRADVIWMRQATPKLLALQGNTSTTKPGSNESLQTIINRTSKIAKLQNAIRRVRPTGNERVQVWIEKAKFNELIAWIELVKNQYGIDIFTISLERDTALSGHVNARVIFIRMQ